MDTHLIRFNNSAKIEFLDFETFNLNLSFSVNRPWQTALITTIGGKIVDKNNIFTDWTSSGLSISKEAAAVTRYNHEEVMSKAISPEKTFLKIYEKLEEADKIIAHNGLKFDIYLIYEWYKMFGKNPKNIVGKFLDTNLLAKGIFLNIPIKNGENVLEYQYKLMDIRAKGIKTNLEFMGRHYGIEFDYENLHDGLNDLLLNIQVWNKLKYEINV